VFGNQIISGDDSDNDNREDVEVLLSEHASIALASSDSPAAVLLGRKEFDAGSEEIDAGCCGVTSADLDVFGNQIISGHFKNLKILNLVGFFALLFSVVI
jgi:hypothetical protein